MPQLCGSLGPCLRPGGLAPFIVLKKGNYNVNVSQQESDPGRRSRWEGGGASRVDGERGVTVS